MLSTKSIERKSSKRRHFTRMGSQGSANTITYSPWAYTRPTTIRSLSVPSGMTPARPSSRISKRAWLTCTSILQIRILPWIRARAASSSVQRLWTTQTIQPIIRRSWSRPTSSRTTWSNKMIRQILWWYKITPTVAESVSFNSRSAYGISHRETKMTPKLFKGVDSVSRSRRIVNSVTTRTRAANWWCKSKRTRSREVSCRMRIVSRTRIRRKCWSCRRQRTPCGSIKYSRKVHRSWVRTFIHLEIKSRCQKILQTFRSRLRASSWVKPTKSRQSMLTSQRMISWLRSHSIGPT